jgi:hypothetical protein
LLHDDCLHRLIAAISDVALTMSMVMIGMNTASTAKRIAIPKARNDMSIATVIVIATGIVAVIDAKTAAVRTSDNAS